MKNILFVSMVILASCRTVSMSQSIYGQYYSKGKDYQYNLNLNKDSSFVFTITVFDGVSTCHGKWKYLSKDTLILNCNEEELSSKLQRGYMTERERKVIVLGKNKLKINKVILKRKTE